jgi:GNAT superfamily N-acetyltransferase
MITTRNATYQDEGFLWDLKIASMRRYVEQVYGWEDKAQRGFFEKGFHPETIQIIQHDGHDVGMYELQERDDDWFLARIEILPEYQNRGIGTVVIKRMIDAVAATDKPFRLQVFKVNPARKLYARMGFIETGETETHILMELPNKHKLRIVDAPPDARC